VSALSNDSIQKAARLLLSAHHAVVLTGAGISTPSGIPDFRSPGTGEWAQVDPMDVVSLTTFRRHPERFYNWLHPLAIKMAAARPNPAHLALAQLEKMGILQAVLTQNIDGLHQKAGSKRVIELHGSLETLTCPACGQKYTANGVYPAFIEYNTLPRCAGCGAILKPDIIFYEENLSIDSWYAAVAQAEQADVFLVAGTSLEVTPVSGLPVYALESGARLIINTISTTHLDHQATVLIKNDISLALPAIVRAILLES
jgi:NAD-dependent deacetylase